MDEAEQGKAAFDVWRKTFQDFCPTYLPSGAENWEELSLPEQYAWVVTATVIGQLREPVLH